MSDFLIRLAIHLVVCLIFFAVIHACGYRIALVRRSSRAPRPTRVPPCQHCGKAITTGVYFEQDDGVLKAWHIDKPACSRAALQDGSQP